jgi:hypothetical protein
LIRVFVGYDAKLPVLYNVLQHSIQVRSSRPVSITPIMLSQLSGIHTRERHPLASTEFSFSRFLVPFLSDYQGWSIFIDNDMLVLDDIAKLWDLRDDRYAVMCTKHDHQPHEDIKFLGTVQTKYEKKNWSSVMMFNNARCEALTPEYVNTASGLELHQFKWLGNDDLIGDLPLRWNHLVGYNPPNPDVSLVHYTLGGPYFDEHRDCEYAAEWFRERDHMLHCEQWRKGS